MAKQLEYENNKDRFADQPQDVYDEIDEQLSRANNPGANDTCITVSKQEDRMHAPAVQLPRIKARERNGPSCLRYVGGGLIIVLIAMLASVLSVYLLYTLMLKDKLEDISLAKGGTEE